MPNDGEPPVARRPRILVCGWAGAGNIGDELLTDWMTSEIEAAGGAVIVTSRDAVHTRDRHPGVDVCRWGTRDLGVVRDVDGVIVGPGGIIQDRTSLWSLPGHLAKAIRAGRAGVPIAAIGIGAETVGRRSSRWLLRRALGDAIAVVTRDEQSAGVLRDIGVEADVAADLVFDLPVPDATRSSHLVIALGPRVAPGRLRPVRSRLVVDDPEPVAAALAAVAHRLDAGIVLTSFRGEGDTRYARALAEAMTGDVELAPSDPLELRRIVAGSRAVITSRYHGLVLALTAGVPTIVRSDQTKLVDLVAHVADDRRAHRAPDWAAVSAWDPPPPGPGWTAGTTEPARRAVRALVEAATGGPESA